MLLSSVVLTNNCPIHFCLQCMWSGRNYWHFVVVNICMASVYLIECIWLMSFSVTTITTNKYTIPIPSSSSSSKSSIQLFIHRTKIILWAVIIVLAFNWCMLANSVHLRGLLRKCYPQSTQWRELYVGTKIDTHLQRPSHVWSQHSRLAGHYYVQIYTKLLNIFMFYVRAMSL